MEQYGNTTTFNVENVLRQNILSSQYFERRCQSLVTWEQVVDEIYETVDHVEPWMSGNARGPSSAFCLLHRLFQLKLDANQIKGTLDHRDSPYIRAVGFLYLRYVCDPKNLWAWVQRYVDDPEEFQPSGQYGKVVTMGEYVRDLLLEQNYFETILSRIPKLVTDSIIEELRKQGLPTAAKGNAGQGGADRRGDAGSQRPASVKASLSVGLGQRAPNRSGVREEGRGGQALATHKRAELPSGTGGGGRDRDRDRDRDSARDSEREREANRPRDRSRSTAARDHERSRSAADYDHDRGGYDRDRGGDRDRDRGGYQRGGYDRDRAAPRSYSRDRPPTDRHSHRDGRERDRRPDDRDRERYNDRRYDRRPHSRSRSRSRDGGRPASDVFRDRAGDSGGRSANDVFKDRPAGGAGTVSDRYVGSTTARLGAVEGRKDYIRPEEVYRIGGSRR